MLLLYVEFFLSHAIVVIFAVHLKIQLLRVYRYIETIIRNEQIIASTAIKYESKFIAKD